MRRLIVVSVSYPFAPVGPDAVGGSEQVLTAIDRALVAAGHRSIVVAMAGSSCQGELAAYAAPPAGIFTSETFAVQRERAGATLRSVLAEVGPDVVHMHGLDFHCYLPPPGPPVLATLHLPPNWYPEAAFEPDRPNTWIQCVSATQLGSTWPNSRMLPPISNGVPVDSLGALRRRRCTYALMLSRICPEKGMHLALQAAHAADCALLLGGEVFPYQEHQDYFVNEVRPLLDRRRRWLGPLGFERKRRLLAGARCLLVPSLVPETSSLVAMEAASCGTPVIAFDRGALPEVVEHGRTGYIVEDAVGMAQAIGRVDTIDPQTCREVARARFSLERMTAAYIARYQALADASITQAA